MAFSRRARLQMADPLAAIEGGQHALLGPGTGPLAAPNGADRDASDDGMSSVGVGEAEARQAFLDFASAQFVGAHGAGIFNENGEEFY